MTLLILSYRAFSVRIYIEQNYYNMKNANFILNYYFFCIIIVYNFSLYVVKKCLIFKYIKSVLRKIFLSN